MGKPETQPGLDPGDDWPEMPWKPTRPAGGPGSFAASLALTLVGLSLFVALMGLVWSAATLSAELRHATRAVEEARERADRLFRPAAGPTPRVPDPMAAPATGRPGGV
jgi:hypothetical protein